MDEINLEDNTNKIFETEPNAELGESESSFSSQMQKDKFLGGSLESPKPKDEKTQTKTYEISGTNVAVNFEILSPKSSEQDQKPDQAIIFLPGWSVNAGMKTAEVTGQAFAEAGKQKVFIIDTKPDKVVEDTLYKEAEAVSRLLKEKGLKRVTIAGYSEGGIRAVDLAVILQQNLDIAIDGVILMESAGLYDQESKKKFVGKFLKDNLVDAPPAITKPLFHFNPIPLIRGLRAGTDVIFGMVEEIARTKGNYPKRVRSQIREMIGTQTHIAELQAPVILIQGENDLVSNPEKIIPGYKEMGHLAKDEITDRQFDPREKFLQENLFQESPYVRMVTGRKISNHVMPIARAEEVTKVSLYLLERYRRDKTQETTSKQVSPD